MKNTLLLLSLAASCLSACATSDPSSEDDDTATETSALTTDAVKPAVTSCPLFFPLTWTGPHSQCNSGGSGMRTIPVGSSGTIQSRINLGFITYTCTANGMLFSNQSCVFTGGGGVP